MKQQKTHFQKSCKLGLKYPEDLQGFCPYGLERARWYMDNQSSSAAEELSAPGCGFAVLSEDEDGYCFFKMSINKEGRFFTEEEIAKRLGLNVAQVKTILARAMLKIKNSPLFEELKELRRIGELYDVPIEEDDIYYPSGIGCGGGFGGEADLIEETSGGEGTTKRGRRSSSSKTLVASPDTPS